MSWIYRYESKGIQRWILESNQLRDLASGSDLIEQLVATARGGISQLEGEIITAAAGGVTALFKAHDALVAFAAEWPMRVADLAPGLRVVQAWVEDKAEPADHPMDRLRRALATQNNSPPPPHFEAGPFIARTGRTGLPAVVVPRDLERRRPWQHTWEAAAVAKERNRAQRGADRSDDAVLAGFDFEEDIDRWLPDGPVAIVHADGSGVGERLSKLQSDFGRFKEFSDALAAATRDATRAAVEPLPMVRGCRIARPVVVGGDDLTFILPAQDGLDFIERWLCAFFEATSARADQLGGPVHAGAGIVFVHRGYPFATGYEHAEAECGNAKKAALDQAGRPNGSVLRLRRITTSRADEHSAALWGSWSLAHISALRQLAAAAAELPRGALRTWLTLIDRGDPKRNALWRRTREIARPEHWRRFEEALRAVDADPKTGLSNAPLDAKYTARTTPVRDALALLQIGRLREGGR